MNNQASWRIPIAVQAFLGAISFSMMLLLPDTPRWYYSKGRYADGDQVLSRLHALPLESEPVQKQKQEILDAIALEDAGGKINVLDFFWDRSKLKTGRRLRIAFLILTLQQLMGKVATQFVLLWFDVAVSLTKVCSVGINVMVYYDTVILANVGLSPFLQQLLAAV